MIQYLSIGRTGKAFPWHFCMIVKILIVDYLSGVSLETIERRHPRVNTNQNNANDTLACDCHTTYNGGLIASSMCYMSIMPPGVMKLGFIIK